ncbi:MAG: indolepyruvate oxidoreductase subunit beta [Deltaproteobacteria bacterium]|nr:indolepyruvate oxidoreductase subunit beta [Deltaproteobacteria bacterium]
MNSVTNILMAGVGGQGVILASEIVSEAMMRAGHDVKKSEVHGMAQRGGSVTTHVRFGEKVFSPLIKDGEVDILFSFELLETVRYLGTMREGASLLVNAHKILPPSVTLGKDSYPDDIAGLLASRYPRFELVDAPAIALQAGNPRAVNVAFVGALSRYLDVPEDSWHAAIEKMLPPKLVEVNLKAFALGREKQN